MQGHLSNINTDQGNLDFVDVFVERPNDITVNNIDNENVCNKSGMFIDICAEIIYDKSDTSSFFAECVIDIVNAVANNIDNPNVCERHSDDTEDLENNCNENLKEIPSNPKVWKAIFAFEEGEMCHEIGPCISCLSVRPVFHSTKCIKNIGAGQPSPIVAEKWKIFKDWRCYRCHQERK